MVYKTSFLNYFIAKNLIRTKYISLPNLILDKQVVPELIQARANPQMILESFKLFEKKSFVQILKQNYKQIRNIIGKDIASQNVAQAILKAHKNS